LVVVYIFTDTHKAMNVNEFKTPTIKHVLKGGSVKLSKRQTL